MYYKRLEIDMSSQLEHPAQSPKLVKTQVADRLRQHIFDGVLQPGEIISETHWGAKLGVAQASIREAINRLIREGLVRKEPGCSARVTSLTAADVKQAYLVRAVLEGLAARLAAELHLDVPELDQLIDDMERKANHGDLRGAIESDTEFHLRLCELPGNPFLTQHARQILIPLFAFTLIRALSRPDSAPAWAGSVAEHRLILTAIRSGDPLFAEQTARSLVGRFVAVAQEVWLPQETVSGEHL